MTSGGFEHFPHKIIENCKKYFSEMDLQSAAGFYRNADVHISFKKGSSQAYFIVSGLVKDRDHRDYEAKITYKYRLIDSPEGPLATNCNCERWRLKQTCSHTASLFLNFQMDEYLEHLDHVEIKPSSEADNLDDALQISSPFNNSGIGVYPKKFGTIITQNSSSDLVNAPNKLNFPAMLYQNLAQKIIPFSVNRSHSGKLVVNLYSSDEDISFAYYDSSLSPQLNTEISLFEHEYIYNWKAGIAYDLPEKVRMFIARVKNNLELYGVNEYLMEITSLSIFDLIIINIDGKELAEWDKEIPTPRVIFYPAARKGLMKVEIIFVDKNDLHSTPPIFFQMMTYEIGFGILNEFKKKSEALQFIESVSKALSENSEVYKKFTTTHPHRGRVNEIIENLKHEKETFIFDYQHQKIFLYSASLLKRLFVTLENCWGANFFRLVTVENYSTFSYEVPPQILFENLHLVYQNLIPFGVQVYYDKKEINRWTTQIKFERRKSVNSWFEVDLTLTEKELEMLENVDLARGIAFTKDGLVLLSQEEREILKFINRYTKFEATKIESTIDGDKFLKKFTLPFNRARIFELFELHKHGIQGALNEEELAICNKLLNLTEMEKYPIPIEIKAQLRPYQEVGYNWLRFLYECRLGACLADDMGLGKTLQTIVFLQSIYANISRVLIVCPVTILLNWEQELLKFSEMSLHIYHGGSRDFETDKKIILTSYGVMKKESESVFGNIDFDVLILDEVQHLKNIRSVGAFSARQIKAGFRLCLTGTPVENDLLEFYNILDLSIPGIWGDVHFVRTVSNKKTRSLARKVAAPFILRRTKEQVLTDLPPKMDNIVYLEFSDTEKVNYHATMRSIKDRLSVASSQHKYGEILRGLLFLRQNCLWQKPIEKDMVTLSTKVDFLMETLESILEENNQAIVFSQFTKYLDFIETKFKERAWKFSRIDGTQSIARRNAEVELFQSHKNPLFLISLKAGGVGLNLTAASFVFIMDPWWNPAVEAQAIDRAHRIGQKSVLTVYRPIIKGSVEEKVLKLQEEKRELFNDLLLTSGDDLSFSGKLTKDDFEKLFEEL